MLVLSFGDNLQKKSFEGTSTNLTNAEKQDLKHILGHNIVKLKIIIFGP